MEYRRIKDCACSSCSSPPTLPTPQPLPPSIIMHAVDGNPFTIMQFNANGIGNKRTELGEFLEQHYVKVAVIQESKLSSNSRTPSIQNFTTIRKSKEGISPWRPESPETLAEPHLEELTITVKLGDITNVYISPSSSCAGGYIPSLDHLMMRHISEYWETSMHTTRRASQIREATYWIT